MSKILFKSSEMVHWVDIWYQAWTHEFITKTHKVKKNNWPWQAMLWPLHFYQGTHTLHKQISTYFKK